MLEVWTIVLLLYHTLLTLRLYNNLNCPFVINNKIYDIIYVINLNNKIVHIYCS